ncbi:MAG: hypothetical protein HY391_02285 [Deltaproteobacteria bacterium]|nr:hypothetical protein [Deltaproteobacteria bacterium]
MRRKRRFEALILSPFVLLLCFSLCASLTESAEPEKKVFSPRLYAFGAASFNTWFETALFTDDMSLGGDWLFTEGSLLSLRYLQKGELYLSERLEVEGGSEIARFVDTFSQGTSGHFGFRPRQKSPWVFSFGDEFLHENARYNQYDNGRNTFSAGSRWTKGAAEGGGNYQWTVRRYFSFERLDMDVYSWSLYYQDDFGWKPWYVRLSSLFSFSYLPRFIVRSSTGGDTGDRRKDFLFGTGLTTWWFFPNRWTFQFGYNFRHNRSNGAEFDTNQQIFQNDFYDYNQHLINAIWSKQLPPKWLLRWSNYYEWTHFPSRGAREREGRLTRVDRLDNNVSTALEALYQLEKWWKFNFNYTLKVDTSTDKAVSFKRNFATNIFTFSTIIDW